MHEPLTHLAETGTIAATISRELVRLHARHYGRGPTKAKTHLGPDHALCVLEDIFTPVERTLIEAGHGDQVNATRNAFQDAMRAEIIDIAEKATGRRVRAMLSQVHLDPEIATEVFLFDAAGTEDHDG